LGVQTKDSVIVGCDLNCDFNRHTHHVNAMKDFIDANDLHCSTDHILADIKHTFESKGSGITSLIDHFLIDKELFGTITSNSTVDSVENLSDHLGVICCFDLEVSYFSARERLFVPKPAWPKASKLDIRKYHH
jgi:hypothetical protein